MAEIPDQALVAAAVAWKQPIWKWSDDGRISPQAKGRAEVALSAALEASGGVLGLSLEEMKALSLASIFGGPDKPHDRLEEARAKLRSAIAAQQGTE
jgi:hypothetical protein